jgi:hypothetical protein
MPLCPTFYADNNQSLTFRFYLGYPYKIHRFEDTVSLQFCLRFSPEFLLHRCRYKLELWYTGGCAYAVWLRFFRGHGRLLMISTNVKVVRIY